MWTPRGTYRPVLFTTPFLFFCPYVLVHGPAGLHVASGLSQPVPAHLTPLLEETQAAGERRQQRRRQAGSRGNRTRWRLDTVPRSTDRYAHLHASLSLSTRMFQNEIRWFHVDPQAGISEDNKYIYNI